MDKQALETAIARIREQLADAEAEAKESHSEAPNSYAAGLDRGLADGLQAALAELVSE